MFMNTRLLFIAGLMIHTGTVAVADVTLPELFSDNMILQREMPVPIWGAASPGEKVLLSFAGQELETKADPEGNWMLKLAPLSTSNKGKTMTVKGSNTITFSEILVGEVWLCSGQVQHGWKVCGVER